MQTSRELVYDTLSFKNPPRVPRDMWALPWAVTNYKEEYEALVRDFPRDVDTVPNYLKTPTIESGEPYEPGLFTDMWGCTFLNKLKGVHGEVKTPLVQDEDWADFSKVHIPVELFTSDTDKINRFCANTDKFVFAGARPQIFEQMQYIRGTEQLYMDIVLGNEAMTGALKQVHDFYCELLIQWAKTDVDALFFLDDWGSQNSLLINPASWCEIFRPLYKDYVDIAHSYGKKIFMHSDGNILSVIPHLIELGVDALNCQMFCMDADELAKFAGQITFWGEIDRQWLLPCGTTEEIENAVKRVYSTLWKDGGCIAQCEFGPGAKPENVRTVYETWNTIHNR